MSMLFDLAQIPTLETDRLCLRGPRPEDERPYVEMLLDDEVSRFVFGPFDENGAWRSFAGLIGHWALRGYGQFIVVERSTGAFVGRVGLVNMPGWPCLELAWTLARPAWGKGYAVEAARAARAHAIQSLRPDRLISLVAPDNARSIRVAERLQARPAEWLRFHGRDVTVWDHALSG